MAYYWTAKILNEYCYGSQVYGTATPESDYDYLVVVDGEPLVEEEKLGEHDFHYISKTKFMEMLDNNDIKALECVFLPSTSNQILKESFKPSVTIDPIKLRHSISATCSNSWVKGKKKILVEGKKFLGLKSIFHSIRIMEFANQILLFNKIHFDSVNWLYDELMGLDGEGQELWDNIMQNFKPFYKGTHQIFKSLTSK